jgi:hypothetical protein
MDSQPTRALHLEILHGCVATLVLCVWNSIHINIAAFRESLRDTLFRKVRWVIVALLAPEAIVFTAFQQWLTAKAFLRELKKLWEEKSLKIGLVCTIVSMFMWISAFLTLCQAVHCLRRGYLRSHVCLLRDNGWFCRQY